MELEKDISIKNKHIRKLLSDVKILEEENTKLKEKLTTVKEKLNEATKLIENLTDQLFTVNNETELLKETVGINEENKAKLMLELETVKKELFEQNIHKESMYDEIRAKVQHWKNIAKLKRSEVEILSDENKQLKDSLAMISQNQNMTSPPSPKKNQEGHKLRELQEKLAQATTQIEKSATIIEKLKYENMQLKTLSDETLEYQLSDAKNVSDENKQKYIINKMKKKIKSLTISLQEAEEMISSRDKELADMTLQMQAVKSEEGLKSLLKNVEIKSLQLKSKNEGIKTLIKEINTANQHIDDLQLENESLRIKFNVPCDENICTKGILSKIQKTEENLKKALKILNQTEKNLIDSEMNGHILNSKCKQMRNLLLEMGCSEQRIAEIEKHAAAGNDAKKEKSEDTFNESLQPTDICNKSCHCAEKMKMFTDENEGLRKGLQEILTFLKDNSTTSSGVLLLECPSLDAVLQSMEARHTAGWFAPHMSTVMELRAALGAKDSLLSALNESRKETFEVMAQLTKELEKSCKLEKMLENITSQTAQTPSINKTEADHYKTSNDFDNIGEFGSWMSLEDEIEPNSTRDIENYLLKRNSSYENYLKKGLNYFHEKFKVLFEKMTSVVIQTADEQNQWLIQEEQYKAEIQSLKVQLNQKQDYDDDISENSPGLISSPDMSSISIQRKCLYLEESYRYIRTLNENMKNEILEIKKESMVVTLDYESQIQHLMLSNAQLLDKLRQSISIEAFWKQHLTLSDIINKYRNIIQTKLQTNDNCDNHFDNFKIDFINSIQATLHQYDGQLDEDRVKNILSLLEDAMNRTLDKVLKDLDKNINIIKLLEKKNVDLQETQSKIIDQTLVSVTKEELNLIQIQIRRLSDENKILKDQNQHIGSQLDIALLQLQDSQQRKLSNDIEINMLRHQILDLQSTSDNKAIIARLSGEVLVAHLQASESLKKIERLSLSLNKEKQSRIDAEEMLIAREKIFDVYTARYESKFRYMYDIMQILRQQYHGSVPIISIENYLNRTEELNRKTHAVNEKLEEVEELQYSLMSKHAVFDQVLDLTRNKCIEEQDGCPHKLQKMVSDKIYLREESHYKEKILLLEKCREELQKYCNKLENNLVLLNQGFSKTTTQVLHPKYPTDKEDNQKWELEDLQSDDESQSNRSQTMTLSRPVILKPKEKPNNKADNEEGNATEAKELNLKYTVNKTDAMVQTSFIEIQKISIETQTNNDNEKDKLSNHISQLKMDNERIKSELLDIKAMADKHSQETSNFSSQKVMLETKIEKLRILNIEKDKFIENLQSSIEKLTDDNDQLKRLQIMETNKIKNSAKEEQMSLLNALKELENDKNNMLDEYKELLRNERDEYTKSMKDLNTRIIELQTKLDSQTNDNNSTKSDALKDVITKYSTKIANLEDKYFKTQNELEDNNTKLITYQSEIDRWKDLANDRLAKMEQLSSQLEARHSREVESYKAENQHWMTQLNEMQREHMELRSRLLEQKALHVKQLTDKDTLNEQLRSVIHNLKTQIISMQTMISVNDPSFDLSCDCGNINEVQEEFVKIPTSSTAIWQEPVLERLRREKQLAGKQNIILRRQIKALAARERRARLDAQNLKNQMFRISTSGNKFATSETANLQNKIASLQAQLSSARRDTQSSVTLWDKWKRAQQSAERWEARYDEKCQELKKFEASLHLAKAAVLRLEKEKRLLLSKVSEMKNERQLTTEKQDVESSEKIRIADDRPQSPPSISARALLERVQAQQRRIVALEVSEKGNELLVSEYEKALAEITSLKGQVLKLESTLLQSQIRSTTTQDSQPELDYWKKWREMLKEENVQLHLRTVLTLRGLVSKLQAEQKTSIGVKRSDSRPGSGKSATDKSQKAQVDSHRIEIANLKRSIQDKDLLLEKSKEMLKIAAEREEELLRENMYLHRRIEELTSPKEGFLSA
ncbi:hypothetical protein ACJJTC_009038 [Scirpophaga incertulas]